jgi:CheY-like chemotaxis protein
MKLRASRRPGRTIAITVLQEAGDSSANENMDNHSWSGDGAPAPWLHSEMKDVFEGASILVVEDDDDTRDLLLTLLRIAGYKTTACSDAESALETLRENTFDCVLTDYALPDRTGGWLLQQASKEGLLDATPALVVTAHPSPADVSDFEIVQKPFDLDELVERVRRRLDGAPRRVAPATIRRSSSGRPGDDGRGDSPDPIELILYVNADTPRSANAIQDIERVLSRNGSGKYTVTICNLPQVPATQPEAITLAAAAAPRAPGPRTFILGHITNPALLAELLQG